MRMKSVATRKLTRLFVVGLMTGLALVSYGGRVQADLAIINGTDQYAKPKLEKDYQKANQKHKNDIAVQILGINDLHGGLDTTGDVKIGDKSYSKAGTVSRLAAYLDQAQSHFKSVTESDNTLRIEAGDAVGAAPANSTLLAHESTMHALKAMKFSIGTLGNHEFDHGLPEFNRILTGKKPDNSADKLLKNYPHRTSGVDMIVANVVNKKNQKIPYGYQPYIIKTVKQNNQTAKVGIIGIETATLPSLTLYQNYKDYDVLDEAETIAKYDKILREKGVNAIIVVAHTGVETKTDTTSGQSVAILNKLNNLSPDNQVGLYVAGHSHQYANAKVGRTQVVQAVYTGKAYDNSWCYIDGKSGRFTDVTSHVYPVLSAKDDPKTKSDKTVANIVKDADKRVNKKVSQVIGYAATNETITGRLHNNDTLENQAGELVADSQLAAAQHAQLNPDFAMTNTGGVRADLAVNKRKAITWGAATAVQPFGNILQVVDMTGAQIRQALNQQYNENQHYYLQIAGLQYTYHKSDETNPSDRVIEMRDTHGTSIEDTKNYRVVINDFLHGGGDNFTAFKNTKIVGAAGTDTDALIKYIEEKTRTAQKVTAPQLNRKIAVE